MLASIPARTGAERHWFALPPLTKGPTMGTTMTSATPLDYATFDAITFDCYGTLIDWETGLSNAFRPVLRAHGVTADAEDVLARFARFETAVESWPIPPLPRGLGRRAPGRPGRVRRGADG